ncbi:hypothetical protein LQ567_10260 [Niabella pedocola]|uniref:Quinol oxidase subunit 4 n=1 Tax=Niabella pedocola TaxID=1752077 RepID=A0ABS8PPX4_9BACT|nr:hypothetical protein [Niabella pedocola]MCD2423147.1 hypothetical protein [Niabella pedocola]
MKRITVNKPGVTISLAILFLTFFSVMISSCADPYYPSDSYYRHGHRYYKQMPPGQAKKYYGAQSARDFAPGHNKRRY